MAKSFSIFFDLAILNSVTGHNLLLFTKEMNIVYIGFMLATLEELMRDVATLSFILSFLPSFPPTFLVPHMPSREKTFPSVLEIYLRGRSRATTSNETEMVDL